jgi:hypothetical protein
MTVSRRDVGRARVLVWERALLGHERAPIVEYFARSLSQEEIVVIAAGALWVDAADAPAAPDPT